MEVGSTIQTNKTYRRRTRCAAFAFGTFSSTRGGTLATLARGRRRRGTERDTVGNGTRIEADHFASLETDRIDASALALTLGTKLAQRQRFAFDAFDLDGFGASHESENGGGEKLHVAYR